METTTAKIMSPLEDAVRKLMTEARRSAFAEAVNACTQVRIARSYQGHAESDPIESCIAAIQALAK